MSGKAFIIMPFDRELDWLHEEIIFACDAEGVTAMRGDDVFAPGSVLQQILSDIDTADMVFAVCTGKSANVFFELGYAWKNHDPILIAEGTHDLPFDVAGHRAVMYGQDNPNGSRATLRQRLRRTIRAVTERERIPQGRILATPPAQRTSARISATLQNSGRGSHRLVLSNTGNQNVEQVAVDVPPHAGSFHLRDDELPIDVLRPGEQVKLLAITSMGGGKSIFDITVRGKLEDGTPVEFPCKISL
ncbi:hypothetical protein [Streptomyces sp. NPDC014764]|uniref:hypothetical protein n=1 Tax=Streptomyces sp. NPDC014764 TaxID=3364907 RepID=UPI0036F63A08